MQDSNIGMVKQQVIIPQISGSQIKMTISRSSVNKKSTEKVKLK